MIGFEIAAPSFVGLAMTVQVREVCGVVSKTPQSASLTSPLKGRKKPVISTVF
jgi:hypothetical protein